MSDGGTGAGFPGFPVFGGTGAGVGVTQSTGPPPGRDVGGGTGTGCLVGVLVGGTGRLVGVLVGTGWPGSEGLAVGGTGRGAGRVGLGCVGWWCPGRVGLGCAGRDVGGRCPGLVGEGHGRAVDVGLGAGAPVRAISFADTVAVRDEPPSAPVPSQIPAASTPAPPSPATIAAVARRPPAMLIMLLLGEVELHPLQPPLPRAGLS